MRDPLLGFATFRGFPSASSPQRLSTSRAPRVLAVYSAWFVLWLALPKQNARCTNRQHPVTLRRSAKPGYPRMLASIRPLNVPPKRVDLNRHADDPAFDCRSSLRTGSARPCARRRSAGLHEHRGVSPPAAEATDRNVRHMNPRTRDAPKRIEMTLSSGQSRTGERRSAHRPALPPAERVHPSAPKRERTTFIDRCCSTQWTSGV